MKKLTFSDCLRDLADNIDHDNCYGVRVGLFRMSFTGNDYEVVDWTSGERMCKRYSDLSDAICAFIKIVNNASR